LIRSIFDGKTNNKEAKIGSELAKPVKTKTFHINHTYDKYKGLPNMK